MQTIQSTHPAYNRTFPRISAILSLPAKFFAWCGSQEQYRLGWLAVILAIHGCVLAPLTVFSIFMGGNDMLFWAMTIGAMAMALISNLAAMPTRITIPIFFLSILIDLAVIIISVIKFVMA